jgi:hypothetical protein
MLRYEFNPLLCSPGYVSDPLSPGASTEFYQEINDCRPTSTAGIALARTSTIMELELCLAGLQPHGRGASACLCGMAVYLLIRYWRHYHE